MFLLCPNPGGSGMEPRLDHRSVIATIRGMVDDDICFTSSELKEQFTLAGVARRLGAPRRAVRRVYNTVSDAADGVRLQKLDELFDRWDALGRVDSHPGGCEATQSSAATGYNTSAA